MVLHFYPAFLKKAAEYDQWNQWSENRPGHKFKGTEWLFGTWLSSGPNETLFAKKTTLKLLMIPYLEM